MKRLAVLALIFGMNIAFAETPFELGKRALQSMTGCYLVDYSYVEVESLKAGYQLDQRVYDVNKDKSVKEWIYLAPKGEERLRLQHILFATDLSGKFLEGSLLKHTGEDWDYEAKFLYDFSKPSTWLVKGLTEVKGEWTRRVTNLDDGLRYQCSAPWLANAYPEWSCGNYAPIPGRETRDMGRKDYQALQRNTRVIAYGDNWLERQENVKTIDLNGVRTPLARELGKNWYVRLPDNECEGAKAFSDERLAFWEVLREAWDEVFTGDSSFIEYFPQGAVPRFMKMGVIEDKYFAQNLKDPTIRDSAKKEIKALIALYRVNQ